MTEQNNGNGNVTSIIPEHVVKDLAQSGLVTSDMRVRPLTQAERHSTGSPMNVDGYVIPYYDITGKPLPFYRVKLMNWDPKYKQLVDEPNHIYFPPGFWEMARNADYILLTEGEKKAACAMKHGFACVAVGGVDSWSNRQVSLPKDTKLAKTKDGRVVAKIMAGQEMSTQSSTLATGMKELIAFLVQTDKPLVIVYDSDGKGRVDSQVQAAAARLGYSLRFHGMKAKNIRQLVLQPPRGYFDEKLGLDDLLVHTKVDPETLREVIEKLCTRPSAFPKHPNPRDYVNRKMRSSRMSREQLQNLGTAILCDLDARGARLYSPDEDDLYYFSRESHELIKANFKLGDTFSKSPFGVHLYRSYNLSTADDRIMQWLGTLYSGEEPISHVKPERVMAIKGDSLYYQISAGQMIRVNAKEIRVLDNGNDDILFQSTAVEPLDKAKLVGAINNMIKEGADDKPLPNYWKDVINDTNIAQDDIDGRVHELLSYIYAISPWFYRWRGTQLPVEMTLGEPGSGKSTLYSLRLNILSGQIRLRNPPKDVRDWGASVGSTGALHVTDNVNMVNGALRQQLSDEICRLITEPNPSIEARKLYTDNDMVNIPVTTVFAVTAVKQPFNNPDLIQRSFIVRMDKGTEAMRYSGTWADDQLARFGGREGWIAQQLVLQHKMFKLIGKKWDPDYRASFRLINFEQLLMLAAEAFGDPEKGAWIPDALSRSQSEKIAKADTVLGALNLFSQKVLEKYGKEAKKHPFSARDISDWAEDQADYKDIGMLTNSRVLGAYLKQNANLLATVAGITVLGPRNNALHYYAHEPKS